MASASKTPNLNLPQWVETEKPERTDFNAAFDAIDTTIDAKANKAMGQTFTATLQNGWTGTLLYSKNELGQVYIRTTVDLTMGTTTLGTAITTLPEGYRPVSSVSINAIDAYGTTKAVLGFYVNSAGVLSIRNPFASEAQTGRQVSIQGIFQT